MRLPILPQQATSAGGSPAFSAPAVDSRAFADPTTQRMFRAAGEGIAQVGAALDAVERQREDTENRARLRQADTYLAEQLRKAQTGPDGYLNAVGQKAVDGYKAASDRLDEIRADAAKMLTNEWQQEQFEYRASIRLEAAAANLDQHYARELKTFDMGRSEARQQQSELDAGEAIDTSTGQVSDFGAMSEGIALHEVADYAEMAGWPHDDPRRQERLLGATTRIHAARVQRLMDAERPDLAKAYLDALDAREKPQAGDQGPPPRSQEISPAARNRLDELVRTGSIKAMGLQASDAALAAARQAQPDKVSATIDGVRIVLGRPPDYAKMQQDALEWLDKEREANRLTTEAYDDAVSRVEHRTSRQQTLQAAAENRTVQQITGWLAANRDKSYEDLLPEQRLILEETGNAAAVRKFANDQRWTTTSRGESILMQLEQNPLLLRGKDLEGVRKGVRAEVDDQGMRQIVALWHDANQVQKPRGLEGDIVSSAIRLSAADDWFKVGLAGAEEEIQGQRMKRYDLAVRRKLNELAPDGKFGEATLQQAIDEVRSNRITVPGLGTVPEAILSPGDFESASYQTVVGAGKEIPVDFGKLDPETKARLEEKRQGRNAAIRKWNENPSTAISDRQPLLPETNASLAQLLAEEVYAEQVARDHYQALVQRYARALRPPFGDTTATTEEQERALREAKDLINLENLQEKNAPLPRTPWRY